MSVFSAWTVCAVVVLLMAPAIRLCCTFPIHEYQGVADGILGRLCGVEVMAGHLPFFREQQPSRFSELLCERGLFLSFVRVARFAIAHGHVLYHNVRGFHVDFPKGGLRAASCRDGTPTSDGSSITVNGVGRNDILKTCLR
jgi:hypothetical protein